ncbi:MAG: DNA starvation/stationary phase protection protein [Halobacteriovoraceae bacterium]|nr:DNA starvation/stationary phase protection protein [Halobacteriovoraceae bacterium]MBC99209.1 DNA starvation/stationary phase protection protein [Halobacteriovoraceae bacterium]|tara:strand:+ start:154927 stop:155397 length:471 start_codon:yes stop_codon:yes gene_type:complete
MALNIGINEDKRVDISKGLSQLLAETYTLYLKTHKYHWNVTGPMFQTLHVMFEEHYTALALAVDEIAERIRVMGVKSPGSYKEFSELSQVKEDATMDTDAQDMIKNLLADHEQVVRTAKDMLPLLEDANDEGTNSLLGARIEYHEKTAWMLKSLLG